MSAKKAVYGISDRAFEAYVRDGLFRVIATRDASDPQANHLITSHTFAGLSNELNPGEILVIKYRRLHPKYRGVDAPGRCGLRAIRDEEEYFSLIATTAKDAEEVIYEGWYAAQGDVFVAYVNLLTRCKHTETGQV